MLASNRRIVVAFVCAAALIVAGMWVVRAHRPAVSHRAVTLPTTLAGLAPATDPRGLPSSANWGDVVQKLVPRAAFAVGAYGPGRTGQGPRLNLTVVRADLTGKFDERMGAAPYTHVGQVTCTQTFDFGLMVGQRSNPTFDAGKVLCWRNSGDLSIVILGLITPAGYLDSAALAVEQAWRAAR